MYLKLSSAKQVITTDSKDDAERNYKGDWYELSKEERELLVKQTKEHYQIRIFIDSGKTIN